MWHVISDRRCQQAFHTSSVSGRSNTNHRKSGLRLEKEEEATRHSMMLPRPFFQLVMTKFVIIWAFGGVTGQDTWSTTFDLWTRQADDYQVDTRCHNHCYLKDHREIWTWRVGNMFWKKSKLYTDLRWIFYDQMSNVKCRCSWMPEEAFRSEHMYARYYSKKHRAMVRNI